MADEQGVHLRVPHGEWWVDLWWSTGAQYGPTELRITASDPDATRRGITTTTLRSLPLAEIIDEVRDRLGELATHQAALDLIGPHVEWAREHIKNFRRSNPTPGRSGRPESFLLATAVLYAFHSHRLDNHPARTLANELDAPRNSVNKWVLAARRADLLTETPERIAGGDLTDKARRLLDTFNEQEA